MNVGPRGPAPRDTHVKIGTTAAFVFVAALVVAAPALAQSGASGPSGMFGATRPNPNGRDSLTLQMAVSEAFDSEAAPEFRTRLPGGQLPGRRSNVLAAAVSYARNRRLVQLSAGTTGFFRYSYDVKQVRPGASGAQVGVGLRMPRRVGTLSLTQGLSYSPSYLYQLLPGDVVEGEPVEAPPPTDPDYRIDARESFAHRTTVRLNTGTGLGWRMVTSAQVARTDFRQETLSGERRTLDGSTYVSYHPTRRGSASFGYRYRESSYGLNNTSQVHEFPLQFDFTPPLTPRRRLTFRVQIAPTLTNTFGFVAADNVEPQVPAEGNANLDDLEPLDELEEIVIPIQRRHRFQVQGEVGVSYPISLMWRMSTAYQRRIQTLAVVSQPVATDGAQMSIAGVIARRIDVAIQARYTRGGSAAGIRGERLTMAQGGARLRFALTRSMALSGEYLYYRYDFGGRLLAPGLPRFAERHGVRVGVSLFTQLPGR